MLCQPPLAQVRKQAISVFICYSLLQVLLAPFGLARGGRMPTASRQLPTDVPLARPGPPEGILPNLDEARGRSPVVPVAPRAVASTLRSRRNPLAPRTTRRVGDPLPLPSPFPSAPPRPSPPPLPSPTQPPGGPLISRVTSSPWWKNDNNSQNRFRYLLVQAPTLSPWNKLTIMLCSRGSRGSRPQSAPSARHL